MSTPKNHRDAYIRHCIENPDRILTAFENTHEKTSSETDLDYITRLAEQDYDDGFLSAAVYQEVWESLKD